MHKRGIVAAVAALGCFLAPAACGTDDPPPPAEVVDERNPLALFLGESLGLIDYAQLKLRNECLAEAGYPQNLGAMVDRPVPAFGMFVITPRTFGPTTESEARRIGFGRDQPAEPPAVVSSDPNYDRAYDDCGKKAWDRLGDDVQDAYFAYFDLGNKISGRLMKEVNDRIDDGLPAKMLTCVRDAGYDVDDEQQFLQTPRPQLLGVPFGATQAPPEAGWRPAKRTGTVEVGPAMPALAYRPTPEESDLAVAWLRCRTSTTLAAQQMATAIAVQNELVAEHETSFTELNPRIRKIAKRATELIGQQ